MRGTNIRIHDGLLALNLLGALICGLVTYILFGRDSAGWDAFAALIITLAVCTCLVYALFMRSAQKLDE